MSDRYLDDETRYRLIKLIEKNPSISQRDLAKELGISLGKANYCIRALINVGWVKMSNFARAANKFGYAYTLTPKGIREKTLITIKFLKQKQDQYELLHGEILSLQREVAKLRRDHKID